MRSLIFIFLAFVLHLACGQYHSSSASVGVNFQNIPPSRAAGGAMAQAQNNDKTRQRRMYAMCPPNFQRVGQECFTYPQQHSSWLEAHFFCKDKNARLAEPEKYLNRKLREFLQRYDAQTGEKDPIWIGATYDYVNNVWQWSVSGHNLTFNDFSKKYFERNPNMDNQCAVYDPQLKYKWTSRTCVDKHRFICQHKMPKVSENNRHKVYHRWNATYPNQFANEVVLEVIDHKGKGRYNRRVIAEGSNEEMVVPKSPRNRSNIRRRPRPTSASLPQENDVNYLPQSSEHPNEIQQRYYPTRNPRFRATTLLPTQLNNKNDNEIVAPPNSNKPVSSDVESRNRKRTMLDRKLQKQREKELKRLQRKRERQEKLRREKEERLRRQQEKQQEKEQQKRKMREEKQRQRAQQQKVLQELRQKENDQIVERQLRERQHNQDRHPSQRQDIQELRQRKELEKKQRLQDQEEERRRIAYLQRLKEQEEEERARKEEIRRQETARQLEEERKLREERRMLDEAKRKEYEEKLKRAENERARQFAMEQERKRLQDEENRRRLEEEEKKRQEELKKQLDEEEERLRLQRLERERIAEEKELARLREEQKKRAEIQRRREEEIARLEAEQKRIEEEEARIKEELEEAERQAKLQHEAEIRRAEEEARAKEEEMRRAEEEEERKRQEKLIQARLFEEARKQKLKERLTVNIRNRLASLPPELRKEFLEKRKQRKKEKLLKEAMLKQQQAESTNNEA